MINYIERFQAIAVEIKTYDFLDLVEFKTYSPATNEIFTAVEAKIGAPLAEPIRNFYGQTNGLHLRWCIKPDLSDAKLEAISKEFDDYDIELPEQREVPFAQINLLPIEDSFINTNWEEVIVPLDDLTFEFQGVTYPHGEFARRLKPFDLFSDYYCMAFLLEKEIGNPKVLLLSDHYAEWYYSRITDFESYMQMLLASRGIVHSRDKIYSEYRGDLKPPLITGPDYWTEEHIPKLFRKKK